MRGDGGAHWESSALGRQPPASGDNSFAGGVGGGKQVARFTTAAAVAAAVSARMSAGKGSVKVGTSECGDFDQNFQLSNCSFLSLFR